MPDDEREFIDDAGALWYVSEMADQRTGPYLAFSSTHETRSLSPVPSEWATIPRQDLRALLERATVIWRRGR